VLVAEAATVVDATEFGDVLALSGGSYSIGSDDGSSSATAPPCTQAITYDFVQTFATAATAEPRLPPPNFNESRFYQHYNFHNYSWEAIWRYRRISDGVGGDGGAVGPNGQSTVQNWGGGNDFIYAPLLLNVAETGAQKRSGHWRGGIDTDALRGAEHLAFAYHYFYKHHPTAPTAARSRVAMNATATATCHALFKVPYLRDTRRSIGVNDFQLSVGHLVAGVDGVSAANPTAAIPHDRIAIGAYVVDIHPLLRPPCGAAGGHGAAQCCHYPKARLDTLPFFLPLRAFTNRDVSNLLVAGKTMATTFAANAATRVHPVEWASGAACGAVAVYASTNNTTLPTLLASTNAETHVVAMRAAARRHTPTEWYINGRSWPPTA